jgi:PKD domain
MSLILLVAKLSKALVCAGLVVLLVATDATASSPASSPLPGYPRFRGVMLVHDGSSASAAREHAIVSALKTASGGTTPNCTLGESPGADLCYWGGPVVGAHKAHLIFWEGGPIAKRAFPTGYIPAVEQYFKDISSASGSNTDVYAVAAQYGSGTVAGQYGVAFQAPADVYIDEVNSLPTAGTGSGECRDSATVSEPCVTDSDLHKEIERARMAKLLEGVTWEATQKDIYFIITPPHVGSCFFGVGEGAGQANACAFEPGGYCAYHSSFENGSKEAVPPLYANIPDSGNVGGCDSFEHPNNAEGVDATLDTISHEHNETVTDPLGNGWFDVIGQEVGDKCLPPETFDIYGGPFGGVPVEFDNTGKVLKTGTLYNQIVGSGHYWLQREWSNAAFNGEGGCVARMLHTEFARPTDARATVPATFDGSASGESGDPAVYWVWAFGDGIQVGTPEPTVSHTYATQGAREVTLTAFDRYGNSNTHTTIVEVGAAPPPVPPPPPPPPPAPITLTKLVTVPAEPSVYTAAQLAAKLGLPGNGNKLAGGGTISLGHAECPPACGVTLQLYATVRTTKRHRTTVKRVLIGLLHTTIAVRGTGALALSLNAKGRALLRKSRSLACKLVVTVEGQEGGTWQIVRTMTLTSGGSTARRARR